MTTRQPQTALLETIKPAPKQHNKATRLQISVRSLPFSILLPEGREAPCTHNDSFGTLNGSLQTPAIRVITFRRGSLMSLVAAFWLCVGCNNGGYPNKAQTPVASVGAEKKKV